MGLLEDLVGYLESNTTLVFGTDLYIDFMPDTPDAIVSLYEAPGGETELTFGSSVAAYEATAIQVMTRGGPNDVPTAKNLADTTWKTLHTIHNQIINGTEYLNILKLDGPFFIDRDYQERPAFLIHMDVMRNVD